MISKIEEGRIAKKVSISCSLVGTLAIMFLLVASPAGLALTYNRVSAATSVAGMMPGVPALAPAGKNVTGGAAPGLAALTSLPDGCYVLSPSSSSWTSVSCETFRVTSQLPKPTEGGKYGVDGESSGAYLIEEGNIAYYPSVPSSPGISDSSWGSGSFSVQANTNGFTGNNGQLDAVQFTDQNDAGAPSNSFCIWQNDVTTQNYNNNCMSLPYYMVGLYGIPWLDMMGYAPGNGYIYAEFCMESSKYCYSISASDEYCLGGCSGEFDKYWSLTGTVLGYGGGSEAYFVKGSSMTTIVGLYQAKSPYASGEQGAATVEKNNLGAQSAGSPSCVSGWCYVETTAS